MKWKRKEDKGEDREGIRRARSKKTVIEACLVEDGEAITDEERARIKLKYLMTEAAKNKN